MIREPQCHASSLRQQLMPFLGDDLHIYERVIKLLDTDFRFASIERADVAVPLLDVLEGLTSDAGGEVHKGGGVIETVAPDAAWRHCATHGLNLTLEKSVCFEHVGASVRSISSFCRGGNKHSTLVLHMMRIQKPSLASDDASCDKRLSDM